MNTLLRELDKRQLVKHQSVRGVEDYIALYEQHFHQFPTRADVGPIWLREKLGKESPTIKPLPLQIDPVVVENSGASPLPRELYYRYQNMPFTNTHPLLGSVMSARELQDNSKKEFINREGPVSPARVGDAIPPPAPPPILFERTHENHNGKVVNPLTEKSIKRAGKIFKDLVEDGVLSRGGEPIGEGSGIGNVIEELKRVKVPKLRKTNLSEKLRKRLNMLNDDDSEEDLRNPELSPQEKFEIRKSGSPVM